MKELDKIIALRKKLHSHPEPSNHERKSREILKKFIVENSSIELVDKGDWFYCVHREEGASETILIRADHDAILNSKGELFHGCGHDGHSAILAGTIVEIEGKKFGKNIIFLFQPAEENGTGAKLCTPIFKEEKIDKVFGLHNMAGLKKGTIYYKPGVSQFASQGLSIDFQGRQSHASEPEKGKNPVFAMAELVSFLEPFNELKKVEYKGRRTQSPVLCTIVEIACGGKNFGINPGKGVLSLTIRSESGKDLQTFKDKIIAKAQELGEGLSIKYEEFDVFGETCCDPHLTEESVKNLQKAGFKTELMEEAFRGSEDFGVYGDFAPAVFFYLGIGEDYPPLHSDEYEFPDETIETGIGLWMALIEA